MARVEHGLPPAATAAATAAAAASSVALLAAKPATVAEKPPVVSLKNKIMMLGQLAKARQAKALQSQQGISTPSPHSPNHPATPKIVMIKAMDAAAPKAKAAAKVYGAKDCNCEWAGADHDRDGRADGCNGGDD